MKSLSIMSAITLVLMFCCCQASSSSMNQESIPFLNGNIEFATKEKATKLLGTSDAFSQSQSPFDLSAKTPNGIEDTELGYLTYASSQAAEWTDNVINDTKEIITEAEAKILSLGLKFDLPETINLVLSSGKEEGGAAGYTRGDFIVVSQAPDVHLFIHELFHVISRYDTDLRDQLYQTIGFEKVGKLDYPSDLLDRKITNPDAPFFEHAIEMPIDGEDKTVVLLTLANKAYEGGSFFQYLTLKFLEIDDEGNTVSDEGTSTVYDFTSATDFTEYIGSNTAYNIHPEEVCAEHFTMLVLGLEVPEPDFITSMQNVFLAN